MFRLVSSRISQGKVNLMALADNALDENDCGIVSSLVGLAVKRVSSLC